MGLPGNKSGLIAAAPEASDDPESIAPERPADRESARVQMEAAACIPFSLGRMLLRLTRFHFISACSGCWQSAANYANLLRSKLGLECL
jgi:hypothetical protein